MSESMTDQEKENRFYALLSQEAALSDEDIQKLLSLWSHPTNGMIRPHIIGMFQGRIALEQIRSIRLFDKASGRLTIGIGVLTVVNIIATAWPFLTSWARNGFRFH
jgi:hypothetical protein